MTYEQFEQYLDEDLGWRKKEISSLLLLAKSNNEEVIFKSLILLIYAHWEGYIKKSSKLYLQYVSNKNIKLGELSSNFKVISLKTTISQCITTKDSMTLTYEFEFVDKFHKLNEIKFKANIDLKNDQERKIIDTESNLNPKVFKNIISILGLNYKKAIETREHYIGTQLLANRNLIGHGSKYENNTDDFSLSLKDIEKLKDVIFIIIDNFREELLEYIKKTYYLNSLKEEREEFEKKQETVWENLFKQLESNQA